MEYQNEHLLPGIIGSVSLLFACIFVLFAGFFFILYNWRYKSKAVLYSFSKNLYLAHVVLVLVAGVSLYYIILNHYFEYSYVWRHSSLDTPMKYIISSFWAGQEGSFLFWIMVQSFVGLFFIRKKQVYTPIVLAVVSLVQFLLLLNIIGISFGGIQVGASPFYLLREVMQDSLFERADYLKFVTDGNGLNPLLLNPWMVSHPPLIFIGYALALAPFALIVSALANRAYKEVLKPAIFWLSTAILFLGPGIIVGGAWAYESLTFGGFWAWDPVENASLVPWLLMIAALHSLLVLRKRNIYKLPSYILVVASFWFVIYASFLTRSGIMSETSVHSFSKESQYTFQLIALLAFIFIIPLVLKIYRRHDFPTKDNTQFLSRAFLMYVGSVILVLSAFQIIFSTSIPVINKIFGSNLAPPLEREAFYNTWQLPFAVAFCVLIALTQYINFNTTNKKSVFKKMWLPLAMALIATVAIAFWLSVSKTPYLLLLFASLLCIFFSLDTLLRFFKTTSNKTAAFTHLGFGIFMLGILFTFTNKEVLTLQRNGRNESVMLLKDSPKAIEKYKVTYKRSVYANNRLYFTIDFVEKRPDNKLKKFTLYPHIILNENMGNVYEPAIRKYFNKDLFMYITYADVDALIAENDYSLQETLNIQLYDTVHFANTYLHFDSLYVEGKADSDFIKDLRITARIIVYNPFGNDYTFKPTYIVRNNRVRHRDAINEEIGIKIRFSDVMQQANTIQIEIHEEFTDYVVVKIVVFPYINLMWLGVFIMFGGFGISLFKNLRLTKVR